VNSHERGKPKVCCSISLHVIRSALGSAHTDCIDAEYEHAFEILRLDTKKIYILIASTAAERAEWLQALSTLINKLLVTQREKRKQRETIRPRPKETTNQPGRFTQAKVCHKYCCSSARVVSESVSQ
jgi:hypothetical protein